MKFLEDGPDIPHELLLARDQGRVIFFCGAGVSRARANLPDFYGLARTVINRLGAEDSSPASRLIKEAYEIDQRLGMQGIISADRVFGLLEREFQSEDIRAAVASALKPALDADLSAHRTLVDLATTREGALQLVTTNFDRLFEDCGGAHRTWHPPSLPDPSRSQDMNGVIYLHGRANADYSGADGDGFVLSSAEFGRAYLADGWATSFIREIVQRYIVVFVGYAADDPPVHYLLEALHRSSRGTPNAYAFQADDRLEAAGTWRHRGVHALSYQVDVGHTALWRTLEAWSSRAIDPDKWIEEIVEKAKRGPRSLSPHERGQVAHVVSTTEGAKRFASAVTSPPAEWLCVFDRYHRFGLPGHSGSLTQKGPFVDPFDLYGLDSDPLPLRVEADDYYSKRDVPVDAWDAFELNRLDRSAGDESFSSFRGQWAGQSPRLVPRLQQLCLWLGQICHQPAAVWWAAGQYRIHESVRNVISYQAEHHGRDFPANIRKAWQALFEGWEDSAGEIDRDWYSFLALVKKDGWNKTTIRRMQNILRPRLTAESDFRRGPIPPALDATEDRRLVRMKVRYPDIPEQLVVPDDHCAEVAKALRRNLELAVSLEEEVGGFGLGGLSPIVEEKKPGQEGYQRRHGLSAALIQFSTVFAQLVTVDRLAAKQEFQSWLTDDDAVFARLRIWAAGFNEIVSRSEFGSLINSLSDDAFWDIHHQRDLLLVLTTRWKRLQPVERRLIETRLVKGPKRWRAENNKEFRRRRAWSTLQRLSWLQAAGLKLSSVAASKAVEAQQSLPDWKPHYADKAADSLEGRSGVVQTNRDHRVLKDVPLIDVTRTALAFGGRTDDFLTENDPFAGLVADCPTRAFAALRKDAKGGQIPEWAWSTFLHSPTRNADTSRRRMLIGRTVCRLSVADIESIIRPASDWFNVASEGMDASCVELFDAVLDRLITTLSASPEAGASGVGRVAAKPDWTMQAINSPTGKIVEALFNDPRSKGVDRGGGFSSDWLRHVERVINLPDELRRHALVLLFHNLKWFYWVDADWTVNTLLPVLSREGDDRGAAWAGLFWSARTPDRELYMLLKEGLLAIATEVSVAGAAYEEILAGMILAGWGSIDDAGHRCITDQEMRRLILRVDDSFRSNILRQARHWGAEVEAWADELVALVRLWPRQNAVRSAANSARFAELAFSSTSHFPELVDAMLPLVIPIQRDHLLLPDLRDSDAGLTEQHPSHALALLYAILPESASLWPYGIEKLFDRIEEADASLGFDFRLIELRRRWDAR